MGTLKRAHRGPTHAEMIEAWDTAVDSAMADVMAAEQRGDSAAAEAAFSRLNALVNTATLMAAEVAL